MRQEMNPMRPIRIKRRCDANVDAKVELRAYVDQLPLDQQHAFVLMATQLINTRDNRQHAPLAAGPRQAVAELQN
jgi:hypothetical protein